MKNTKCGIIVSATEEFLRRFIALRVLSDKNRLAELVKTIILTNYDIPIYEHADFDCDMEYHMKNDTYLFRIKTNNSEWLGKIPHGFVKICEGAEYPSVGWWKRY
jgi:hypothetical protein